MSAIYEFSAYHGAFLALVIIVSKFGRISANRYLAIAILFFSFSLFEWSSYAGLINRVPHLALLSNPFLYTIAPLIWLYVRRHTKQESQPEPTMALIALLPGSLYLLGTYEFYLLPGTEKLQALNSGTITNHFYFHEAIYPILYVSSSILFLILALRELRQATQYLKSDRLNSLRFITFCYSIFAIIGFLDWFLTNVLAVTFASYHLTMLPQTVLIQMAGYIAIINPTFLERHANVSGKYSRSSMSSQQLAEIETTLLKYLQEAKPFLEMDLSPADIADQLGISKHQLSQVLSQRMGLSFYELINKYRIVEAQEMIKAEDGQSFKLIHIAFDSGFSNKTTFLRNFKKFTGLTPSQYRESLQQA